MIGRYSTVGLFSLGLWMTVVLTMGGALSAKPSYAPPSTGGETRSIPNDSTHFGVVWSPPDALGPALRTLSRIHAAGATAIRLTALPAADTIFARADTLGLALYVDLPVSYASASTLSDALSGAQSTLDRIRVLARRHPSVQYVGLAQNVDTTVPAACSVLQEWTTHLHDAPASLHTYYVTPFSASSDRCTDAVDLSLLDTRGLPHPVDHWREWAGQSRQAGLGALGTWTRPDAGSGLEAPHSAERQARYLEQALTSLLSEPNPPPALFVSRWRDRPHPPLADRDYGLHDRSGTRRPAAAVVEGIYTGSQRVFAFASGVAPPSAPHRLLLFGWGLIALLAVLYAQSPFMKRTAVRYFGARGFYQDAVQKGRDIKPGMNATLLLLVGSALGVITLLLTRMAAAAPVSEHVVAALAPPLSGVLARGLSEPGLAGAAVGGLTLLLLIGWTVGLVLVARRETTFSFSQGLMLVAWPCWPVLPGLIVALVTATHPPISPDLLAVLLLGGGLLTIAAVTIRVLHDYGHVTGTSTAQVVALILPSPLVLLALTGLALVLSYDLPFSFLWSLLTQT